MGTGKGLREGLQPEVYVGGGEGLVNEGFSLLTPERWKKIISHVQQKIEDRYWEHDACRTQWQGNLLSKWKTALMIHPLTLIPDLKRITFFIFNGSYRSH